MKTCSKCGVEKELGGFAVYNGKPHSHCRLCQRAQSKSYRITLEQYDAMLSSQNGVCAACGGVNASGKPLFVDHNHTTGQVRGLLCSMCNSSIGLAKESADILKKLASYLEKHETLESIGAL